MTEELLTRYATLRWLTSPPRGVGRLSVASSAFAALNISLAEGDPVPGETTPGELLAASIAGYVGMHLALRMQESDTPLRELVVEAQLTITPWPEYLTRQVELTVEGRLCASETFGEQAFTGVAEQTLETAANSLGLRRGLIRLATARLL